MNTAKGQGVADSVWRARFMAVSRLLDKEMLDAEEAARAAEGTDDAEEK